MKGPLFVGALLGAVVLIGSGCKRSTRTIDLGAQELVLGSPIQLERVPTYGLVFSSDGTRLATLTVESLRPLNDRDVRLTVKVRDVDSGKTLWSQDTVLYETDMDKPFLVPLLFGVKRDELICLKTTARAPVSLVRLDLTSGGQADMGWFDGVPLSMSDMGHSHNADWTKMSFSFDLDTTGEHPSPLCVTLDNTGAVQQYKGTTELRWDATGTLFGLDSSGTWSNEKGNRLEPGTAFEPPDRVRGPLRVCINEQTLERAGGQAFVTTIWLEHSSATIREKDGVRKGTAAAVVDAVIDCGEVGLVPKRNLVYISSQTETKVVPFQIVTSLQNGDSGADGGP